MVAYLKKPTGSEGFQEIVDFLNGSHIRYALTTNPTIYVSLIEKLWQTTTVKTVDNGEQEITTTVDGKEFTVTEASVRRHIKLADVEGISVLPTTEIFDQLSLMGYVLTDDKLTFQKVESEGSGHPSEPQPPPSTAQPTNKEPIPTVVSSSHQKTQTPRDSEDSSKTGEEDNEIDLDPDNYYHQVTTAGASISTASPPRVFTAKDISTTKTLVYIRRSAAKDKGKAKIDESKPEQTKTKLQQRQERAGYEAAVRLQEKLNEEERKRISKVHEEASSFNIEEWEDIQAIIKADEDLAQRIQAEEREKYSEAKKARLLAELINQRKRYFA
ncbi:hypothetical protein Tco_0515004 [Tanacetum coccineum]